MKITLHLPSDAHAELMEHLLPQRLTREEAAFLFVAPNREENSMRFEFLEAAKLGPADFAYHESDYLEMTDETRARLIKRAHDMQASLVEIHSHLGHWPAAFSPADFRGLQETVPHLWWRLAKRPYLALVVARSGFDALAWIDDPEIARPLDGLVVGDHVLRPTNNSISFWS